VSLVRGLERTHSYRLPPGQASSSKTEILQWREIRDLRRCNGLRIPRYPRMLLLAEKGVLRLPMRDLRAF
jgi:hypothetical protein